MALDTIRDILSAFLETELSKQELYFKVGRATDIDLTDNTFTFTPNDETAKLEKCLLKSISTDSGGSFVVIPAENSFVLVGFSSSVTGVLLFAESADKIIMNSTDIDIDAVNKTIDVTENLLINAQQTIFNSGSNAGLIKIVELTTKLNDLVAEVNAFRTVFNGHRHTGITVGTGLSLGPNQAAAQATNFNKDDYENKDITH